MNEGIVLISCIVVISIVLCILYIKTHMLKKEIVFYKNYGNDVIKIANDRFTTMEIKATELEKKINFFESVCNIGVDVHTTTDSWAVVCIAGKKEYIDFVRLDHHDARDVVDFLKQFKRSKTIIDAPYGFIDCLRW